MAFTPSRGRGRGKFIQDIKHEVGCPVKQAQSLKPTVDMGTNPIEFDEIKSNHSSDNEAEFSKAETSLLQKVVRTGLIISKHDIEVQRKDPNSPLYSVKSFEALHM